MVHQRQTAHFGQGGMGECRGIMEEYLQVEESQELALVESLVWEAQFGLAEVNLRQEQQITPEMIILVLNL